MAKQQVTTQENQFLTADVDAVPVDGLFSFELLQTIVLDDGTRIPRGTLTRASVSGVLSAFLDTPDDPAYSAHYKVVCPNGDTARFWLSRVGDTPLQLADLMRSSSGVLQPTPWAALAAHESSVATTEAPGHVQPDGTTITIADGVISAPGGGGGTSDHAALDNLDYASSGHTGFASTDALTAAIAASQTYLLNEITPAIEAMITVEQADERYTPIAHATATDNPHSVTAAQVGADPTGTAAAAVAAEASARAAADATLQTDINTRATSEALAAHTGASANAAHPNFAADVQAVGDARYPLTTALTSEATARAAADATLQTDINTRATSAALTAHTGNSSNPHNTTAGQVGADPTGTASAAVATHAALSASSAHPNFTANVQTVGDARYIQLLSAMRAQRVSGWWYHALAHGTVVATVSATLQRLWLIPTMVTVAETWDRIALEITVVGSNDIVITLGLYSRDAATGAPGSLLATFGTITNASGLAVAVHQLTISQAMAVGTYYVAMLTTGTTAPTIRSNNSGLSSILGAPGTITSVNGSSLILAGQTSLPASITASSLSLSTNAPQIDIRIV